MVDGESQLARLQRLERLIDQLERVRAGGEAAYLADEDLRMMSERRLELAIQICIDIGAHLVSELSSPIDDRRVFAALEHLDDLRAFAVVVQRFVSEE